MQDRFLKVTKVLGSLLRSPKIVTGVGVVVAIVQLAVALEEFSKSARIRGQIGFRKE